MARTPTRINFSYRLARFLFGLLTRFWIRRRVLHVDRVPTERGVILASNHVSYLDPIYLVCSLQRLVIALARDSAYKVPVLGWLLHSWNVIPVDQSGSGRGLKTFFTRLRAGDAVMMYPEGTRSATGQIQAPQPGVGLIILKSEAPVVPVRLFGAFEAYNRHHWLPRPYRVEIKFGESLDFSDLRARANETKDKEKLKALYHQAATDLLHAIATIEPGTDRK